MPLKDPQESNSSNPVMSTERKLSRREFPYLFLPQLPNSSFHMEPSTVIEDME